jgi:DNA (cytosine-5)-methyltransferase 1
MTDKLKVLDLFSGIGGFSLGLERTGGFETVAFCEIEPFPQKVLRKHWPEVPIYEDVRELTAARLTADGITQVDVITGGFPCQDISITGKKAGIGEGTRSGLWSECKRLVGELRPRYALFENVSNLLNGPSEQPGGWFSTILQDLAQIGYDAEWHDLPASYVGATHRRGRTWVIAYPPKKRPPSLFQSIYYQKSAKEGRFNMSPLLLDALGGNVRASDSYGIRKDDGFSKIVDRLGGCGNAVFPYIPELIGHAILEAEKQMEIAA